MISEEEVPEKNIETMDMEKLKMENNSKINGLKVLLKDENLDMTAKNNIQSQMNSLAIQNIGIHFQQRTEFNSKVFDEIHNEISKINSNILTDKKNIQDNKNIIDILSRVTTKRVNQVESNTEKKVEDIKKQTDDLKVDTNNLKVETSNLKNETKKTEKKVEVVNKIIKESTIFEKIEDTIENVGKFGSQHATSFFDKIGLRLKFLKKINPFVLGIIIVCILLAIAIFIFTVIFHKPLYEFPVVGRFLSNLNPFGHNQGYNQGFNQGHMYSRTSQPHNAFGPAVPGPPGEIIDI